MRDFLRDIRQGGRLLLRQPGFSLVAILALSVGIGANTAIFSIVNAILIRSLPYDDPDRLVLVFERTPSGEHNAVSAANFLDWRAQSRSFSSMTAIGGTAMVVASSGEPERIPVLQVSAGYFEVFAVRPALGRPFSSEEDVPGGPPVALLSHGAWLRRFGGDTRVIGQTIALDGKKFTIIGVLPEQFRFFRPFEVLMPLDLDPAAAVRDYHSLTVLARLKPETSLEQANAEMEMIAGNIARLYPRVKKDWSAMVRNLHEWMSRGPRADMPILFGAAGFVLLIACANVANLLLARAAARRREMAVRSSLGAGRRRLLRQLLSESLLLALPGGALGILLASWLLRVLGGVVPERVLPPGTVFSIDIRVLAFTFALSLVTALVFGLAPALRASRVNLRGELSQGSRGSTGTSTARLRGALVVAELALALILLASAGLIVRSLIRLQHADPGFDSGHVLTARIELPAARYKTPDEMRAFMAEALTRLAALPGTRGAGFSTQIPMRGWAFGMPFEIVEHPAPDEAKRPAAHFLIASAGYLRALGVSLKKGREFTEQDAPGSPRVAIVNETFAARFLTGEDPLGKHVRVQELIPGRQQLGPWQDWEIVGVAEAMGVGDINARSPEIYVPHAQRPFPNGFLAVRTTGDPLSAAQSVRAAVRALDSSVVLSDVLSMDQVRAESFTIPRVLTSLISGFGALALLLATSGVYGLMSWQVTQRTQEIGIRTALGAARGQLLLLVLRQGLVLAAIGTAIGLVGALALARVLRNMLFGLVTHDPVTFLAAPALLVSIALAASYLPARRAAGMDPVIALRQE